MEVDNGAIARLKGQLERILGLVQIVQQYGLAIHRDRHNVFSTRVLRIAAEGELGRFRLHLDLAESGAWF